MRVNRLIGVILCLLCSLTLHAQDEGVSIKMVDDAFRREMAEPSVRFESLERYFAEGSRLAKIGALTPDALTEADTARLMAYQDEAIQEKVMGYVRQLLADYRSDADMAIKDRKTELETLAAWERRQERMLGAFTTTDWQNPEPTRIGELLGVAANPAVALDDRVAAITAYMAEVERLSRAENRYREQRALIRWYPLSRIRALRASILDVSQALPDAARAEMTPHLEELTAIETAILASTNGKDDAKYRGVYLGARLMDIKAVEATPTQVDEAKKLIAALHQSLATKGTDDTLKAYLHRYPEANDQDLKKNGALLTGFDAWYHGDGQQTLSKVYYSKELNRITIVLDKGLRSAKTLVFYVEKPDEPRLGFSFEYYYDLAFLNKRP